MNKRGDKKAQVWVETVTYTLIGLTVIGLLLAGIRPKIEESRDKSMINQIKESLERINGEINDVRVSPGNQRRFFVNLEKGRITVSPESDRITWEMDSKYKYSEPGVEISEGNLIILTDGVGPWNVNITLPFEINLTSDGTEIEKEFRETSTPYEFTVRNNGGAIDIKNIN